MNISATASMTGLPPKTIRYYEDIGLVVPDRSPNGYRRYEADHVHRLAFIQRARGRGFGIEDVPLAITAAGVLLDYLQETQRTALPHLRGIQLEQEDEFLHLDAISRRNLEIEEIDRKLAELNAMRATLTHLAQNCHGDDRPDCPILDDLAAGLGAD